jgi:peptidoglycan/xylan/chitin deacetylase (PgdA/CDA1 family)
MRAVGLLLLTGSVLGAQTATPVWQVNTRARVVALTFDAGADRGYAAGILQTLERNHVRATFGMTGRWASMNPDLVKRMARDHDTFINHTYDHQSFTGLSTRTAPLTRKQRIWEIDRADSIIRRITGHSSKPYFRPPFGDYDTATLTLARQLGYRYAIMWTVDSGGWEHLPPATILQRCLSGARPGAILLMHVGAQSQDAMALQGIITGLKRRHYHLVTVPQLLHY